MRVDRTGGVDEHQHLGVGQQRAGQRQALPLTARELPTALVHVRVESLRQRLQHVVGRCHAQRLEDVAVVNGPVPRVQLVTQRPGEQPRLRFGHEDAVAHRVQGQALERYVAERDAVLLDQPTQPVRDGRCLVGSLPTSPVIRPGSTVSPDIASARTDPTGGAAAGSSGSEISGRVSRTPMMRVAPTSERVNLSADSIAVRIGTTRKKA